MNDFILKLVSALLLLTLVFSACKKDTTITNNQNPTAHFNGTPDSSHFNGTPDSSHFNGTPDSSHFNGIPDLSHFNGTPDSSHFNRTPDLSHLNGTPDLSHLNGTFLCQAITHDDISGWTTTWAQRNDTFDVVIESTVNGCTLTVDGTDFDITSEDQTRFSNSDISYSYGTGTAEIKTVQFTNNFQSIEITYYTNNGHLEERRYVGNKTSLPATTWSSATADLAGQYAFTIRKYNLRTGLNTNYTATLPVTIQGGAIVIENKNYRFFRFHSYAKKQRNTYNAYNNMNDEHEHSTIKLYSNNAFKLTYTALKDSTNGTRLDHIHYSYYGTKL